MSTLEEIKKGVEACRTYNFGMRYADKLAHEDADKLIAALEAVEGVGPYLLREHPSGCDRARAEGWDSARAAIHCVIAEALK